MDKFNNELKLYFLDYLESYFIKRDISSTIKMFSSMVTGFGTGFDEKSYSLDTLITLYKRDLEQVPSPVHYKIQKLHITSPTHDTGIVSCELNIKIRIMDQEVKLNHLRLSMFWVQYNQKWLIEHMHISLPTEAHEENEAYPIKELEERNNVLQRLVDEKTNKLNDAIYEISKLATTDKLTGLFNRLKIEEIMTNELQRSQRYKNEFSIILLDIDDFKKTNDTFGHLTGDKVLVEFSDIISRRVRKTDFCGRWGGEEFIVICPETPLVEAANLAETIRYTIETRLFEIAGQKTASFGVTTYLADDTIDSMILRADQALYAAKKNGRNQVSSQ